MHEEKMEKRVAPKREQDGAAIPPYLMDRQSVNKAKVLSNMVKQKRKEKAGKWQVPLPKVRAMPEAEVFKVYKSGKRRRLLRSQGHCRTNKHQKQPSKQATRTRGLLPRRRLWARASHASRQSTSDSFVRRVCATRRRT